MFFKHFVFPTYVGMVRTLPPTRSKRRRFPHVCGDGPNNMPKTRNLSQFSPRMWGWSVCQETIIRDFYVFPTYVGMVQNSNTQYYDRARFPHVCGDGPLRAGGDGGTGAFSPRMWGWSGIGQRSQRLRRVFPTYVGMVRGISDGYYLQRRFPHVCGDGPCHVPTVPR